MKTGSFKTNDGVQLSFQIAGSGVPLILLPGWSLTAALFKPQLEALSGKFQVVAIDPRGHGESEAPEYGYRMHRHAMDLHQLMEHLDLKRAHVVGHSMGCCVIWAYFDLFGSERLDRVVFADMVPHPFGNTAHTEEEIARFGSIMPYKEAIEIINGLNSGHGKEVMEGFIGEMVTEGAGEELRIRILSEAMRMRGDLSAKEFLSDVFNDWRDILPRIDRPALYIAGEGSFLPISSIEWCASQTPGARFEMIPVTDGGSHMMYIEASESFNRLVGDFLS